MTPSDLVGERVVVLRNARIFDGTRLIDGQALRFENGVLSACAAEAEIGGGAHVWDFDGDVVSPGFVDLQVNGGGGIMFNGRPDVQTVAQIARAHRNLGTTTILPTLITDTPDQTRDAIAATIEAVQHGVPGVAGLHLEGPHLSVARKGAHDPALIRQMEPADLDALCAAARALPVLMVTLAPESVTETQVATLTEAGVIVSLGHTDADFDTCFRYIDAGARCVTHLFNAMSQLGSRSPGLVGAALSNGTVSAGLIADAVHVHPQTIRAAWAAKTGPGAIFLVSDAMAVAGTDSDGFDLGGRRITRRNGVLTLADGTLAGADLDLTRAISVMVKEVGLTLEQALRAAIETPARLIGRRPAALIPGQAQLSDLIRIRRDLTSAAPLI
ncbi:N-acetylglucosamine-6-phosphate deacetylase [Palleronia caenipelagi]|uniref:N-acetylglucosamine-6-phosphate deacetylase n=1 Tax=Palleronia caenipelagi TaxID=2489174 RepID=A0A547Q2R7_9RHOB|nr:N-acetylglucosamine-6-phosphate deacetylase [Palleronia caenipelagi]TRD20638.1 N-acetylglucosamine-6-phosphate deacetylase [Palleronia caenipelagi]